MKRRAFKNGDGPEGVDAYLASVPPRVRALLARLRRTIKAAAPGAQEGISYSMPAYKLNEPLVFFAADDKHCGFYGVSKNVLTALKDELTPYRTSSTTLHFWLDKALPEKLVTEIVRRRVAENEGRAPAQRRA